MLYTCSTLLHVFRIGPKQRYPIVGGSSGANVPINGASKHRKQSTTETSLTTTSTTTAASITTDGDKQIQYELRARENFFENWIFYKICAVKSYDVFFLF